MSLQEIKTLIQNYYDLDIGIFIDNHTELININDKFFISRKSIKHIIEKRKQDGYDIDLIYSLFEEMFNLYLENKYKIVVDKKDGQTLLFIDLKLEKTVSLVAVIEKQDESYIVVTGFYRATSKIKKLL